MLVEWAVQVGRCREFLLFTSAILTPEWPQPAPSILDFLCFINYYALKFGPAEETGRAELDIT